MPLVSPTVRNTAVHILAATLALFYAWEISQTTYFQTGLQFVAPVLIILGVHFVHLAFFRQLTSGFSDIVYRRSTQTAVGMALAIFAADTLLPSPAQASADGVGYFVLIVLFCATVVVVVVAVFLFVMRLLMAAGKSVINAVTGKTPKDDDSTRYDYGSLCVVAALTLTASLEGLPNAFDFAKNGTSTSSRMIVADPLQVWNAMDQATSAAFPLPDILRSFPKPTEVVTDEGVHLGAMREVKFEGREGAGCITLRVVERTANTVRFAVISDTTPYAAWVKFQTLTYVVVAEEDGTRLDVSLAFDGQLAPAWFFKPAVKGAAYLAMDVLVRDVKERSESLYDRNT